MSGSGPQRAVRHYETEMGMPVLDFSLRLAVAVLLGCIIGSERQWRQRFTGLRTNTLVAIGACLFVELGSMLPSEASEGQIVAYVISGIGFLAGGVILKEGSNIRGLNTAATVWCTAAIGAMVGAGFLAYGAIGVCAILVANLAMRPLARRIRREAAPAATPDTIYYHFELLCRSEEESTIRRLLLWNVSHLPVSLYSLKSEDTVHSDRILIDADMSSAGRNDSALEQLVTRLSVEPSVSALSWRIMLHASHGELAPTPDRTEDLNDGEDL
jgi:putative Mg2+ transporter-C (MgtC) family protein